MHHPLFIPPSGLHGQIFCKQPPCVGSEPNPPLDPQKVIRMNAPLLPNFFAGRWQHGSGEGTPLFDPVLGTELARVSSAGIDLAEGFAFAREHGGPALRALSYGQRAALLAKIVEVLQAHRDSYYEIATANSGTVAKDSGVDIDGALFTLGYYAKQGAALGEATLLLDGERIRMARTRHSRPSTSRCPRPAWPCSSTPSTSPAGACGKKPPPPCSLGCR